MWGRIEMGSSRARGVALLLVSALVVSLGLVSGALAPASAATYAAPSVSLRVTGTQSVTVSGRTATASPRVRFRKYTKSGWVLVKRIRAHRHRYSTTLTVAAGSTVTFKATSDRRSRKFVVRMPAPAPTLYDDCGARPRKADGSAWSCSFHDDFDGTALDRTRWVPQQRGFMTGDPTAGFACYVDDRDHVAVGSGMLTLTVRKEPTAVPCGSPTSTITTQYTAGSVSTYHLFSQQYGRFEARIRNTASTSKGLHEAFWLWPDDRYPSTVKWPEAGEIDIVETYSVQPDLAIPFLHYSADAGGPQPGVNTAWNCTAHRGQWNTYALVWGPSRLEVLVNGKSCLVNTSADPAFRKPYIVALTAALGVGTNTVTSTTPLPATMQIDYVRAWR
jgi:beta-glucanase (GH16 family)